MAPIWHDPARSGAIRRDALQAGAVAVAGQYLRCVTDGSESEQITLRLSLEEAMTVLSALRQYQPYWLSAREADEVAELFEQTRLQIDAVIAKLRGAASPAQGAVG